jgi:CheY-like chemotaxis protein
MQFFGDRHYTFMNSTIDHPTRILLVDDDRDDCSFFQEALKETGLDASLEVANDYRRIKNLLSEKKANFPDLIFLDLNMPEVNGKECLREIRSSAELNDIPVIIFSTACQMKDVEETFKIGASLYVQKPAGFALLIKVLKKIIQLDWRKYLNDRKRDKFVFTNR